MRVINGKLQKVIQETERQKRRHNLLRKNATGTDYKIHSSCFLENNIPLFMNYVFINNY